MTRGREESMVICLPFNRMTAVWHSVLVQKAVRQVLKVVIPAPTSLYLGFTGNEFVALCVV